MAKLISYTGVDGEDYVLIYQKTAFFNFDKNIRDDVQVKGEIDIPDVGAFYFPVNIPLAINE